MFKLVLLALTGRECHDENQPGGQLQGGPAGMADRPAARLAAALAARHGSAFAALAVCPPLPDEPGRNAGALPGEQAQTRRRIDVEVLLRELMPRGLTADVMVGAGLAHTEILQALQLLEPDMLVLGQAALQSAEGATSQGTSQDEVLTCTMRLAAAEAPCPVLVAPAPGVDDRPAGPFERILVGVDADGGEAAETRPLLDFAARLAAREGAELTVLQVLPPSMEIPPLEPHEQARRAEAAANRLAYLCQGLPGAGRFAFVACEGAPDAEILKNAQERKADLVVLAPGAQAGTTGVCAHVLRGARLPVLLAGPAALAAHCSQAALYCTPPNKG